MRHGHNRDRSRNERISEMRCRTIRKVRFPIKRPRVRFDIFFILWKASFQYTLASWRSFKSDNHERGRFTRAKWRRSRRAFVMLLYFREGRNHERDIYGDNAIAEFANEFAKFKARWFRSWWCHVAAVGWLLIIEGEIVPSIESKHRADAEASNSIACADIYAS